MLTHGDGSSDHEIVNFGVSGRTALKKGDYPYWVEPKYKEARDYQPDIVIIMFGTNDCKTFQWNETDFAADYTEMIGSFLNLDSKPTVYVMVPPPLY